MNPRVVNSNGTAGPYDAGRDGRYDSGRYGDERLDRDALVMSEASLVRAYSVADRSSRAWALVDFWWGPYLGLSSPELESPIPCELLG